jgi:hypothetical protein
MMLVRLECGPDAGVRPGHILDPVHHLVAVRADDSSNIVHFIAGLSIREQWRFTPPLIIHRMARVGPRPGGMCSQCVLSRKKALIIFVLLTEIIPHKDARSIIAGFLTII